MKPVKRVQPMKQSQNRLQAGLGLGVIVLGCLWVAGCKVGPTLLGSWQGKLPMGGDSGDGNDSSNSNSLITNKVSFQFFNDGSYTGDLGSIMKLGGRYTLNGNQASLSVATFNGMPIEKVTALAKARNADSMVPSDLGLTGTLNADGTKLELKFSSPVMGGMAINLTR